ncbi:hypothetical protein ABPG72_016636 [Tetrahymena utriculariae]
MSKPKKKGDKNEENPNKLTEAQEKALNAQDKGKWEETIIQIKEDIASKQYVVFTLVLKLIYELNETIRINNEENKKLNQKLEFYRDDKLQQQQFLSSQYEKEKNIFEERLMKKEEIKKIDQVKFDEEKQQELRELRQKLDELNTELTPLRPYHVIQCLKYSESNLSFIYQEKEKYYQDRIDQLRREERDCELAHHDELQRNEKEQSQKLIQMDNISQAKIDDNKKSAPKAAEKDARDKEELKIQNNQQLRQQLIIKQREVQEMRRERDAVLKQNKNFKLNLQVNKEGILEYQIVNQRQENKIKTLKEEVEALKQQISDDVTKQTKNLEFMKLQDKQKKEELQKEIAFIKNELKIKVEELKRVKALAEIIVDQRSDIEQFFLEALQKVKEQISQKYKINKRSHSNSSSLKLPELSIKSNQQVDDTKQQNNSKFYQDKVDVSELDLEEKEKLLRILFRKMNLGVQPLSWDENR